MSRQIIRKWRPPLLLILSGALAMVLAAPFVGYLALRFLGEMLGTTQALVLICGAIILLTSTLGFLLWRLILRPVKSLSQRAEAIKKGDVSAREPLEHYGTPELLALGQNVLDMAEVLHNREATIRNYTNHITHELKTPLTAVRGAAELLGDAAGRSVEDQKLIATILESSSRMEELLIGAQKIAAARDPAHIGSITLAEILPDLKSRFANVEFEIIGLEVSIPLKAEGLEIILQHLIENSAEHGAKLIHLNASTANGSTSLKVQDDGLGISEGNRDRIFTPFFTTNRANGGTGMGLSIVQNMVRSHQGEIFLQSEEHETTFVIRF